MINGMIIRNSERNDGELMIKFDENQANLVNHFIENQENQEFDFIVHFLSSDEQYLSSRTFNARIELKGEDNVIIQEDDLYISARNFSCIKSAYGCNLVVIENFNRELCEEFNCEYFELEIE